MAKKDTIKNLGGILGGLLQQRSWNRRLHLHQVFLFWEAVVGLEISKHAKPHLMKGDVLWVNVSDSVWMQQLQYEKQNLLDQINRRLQRLLPRELAAESDSEKIQIADIRFHLGSDADNSGDSPPEREPAPAVVDPDRLARIEHALQSLGDKDLAESLKRVWLANERRSSLD